MSALRARHAVLALAMLLIAAGCGVRWDGAQKAEMTARYRAADAGSARATGDTVASAGSPGSAGDASQPASGSTSSGSSGSAGSPTGGAGGSGAAPAVARTLPCAAPSTAPGVTDKDIAVGTVNSLSGPIPGLGASYLAATKAYVAYRNASGGVCGRQIRLVEGDDTGDNATDRSVVADMAPKILAFDPGIAGGGDGGADVLTQANIPAVGLGVSPKITAIPTYFGMRPPLPKGVPTEAKYRYLYAQGVRSVAVVYVAAASAPAEAASDEQLMKAAGIRVALDLPLPLTTLSYDSAARAVANSKADYLYFIYEQGASASMARSMAGTGYKPKFSEYIVAYGSKFIDLAGTAAEGATTWIDSLPAEDGGTNPEQALYLRWMARTAPGASLDPFAAAAWAAAKALDDALETVPGPLTRDAVLTQLRSTHSYDAGGLIGPLDLGGKTTKGCFIAMIVRGGRWQRLTPATGFLC